MILLLARYRAINLKLAENWEDEYQPSGAVDHVAENVRRVNSTADGSGTAIAEDADARLKKLSPAAAKRLAARRSTRGADKTSKPAAPQTKKP
jgi:hypothetical protein